MQDQTEGPVTGSAPRPDIFWRVGKTAASIRFVDDAAAFLAAGYGTPADRRMLAEAVDVLRSGGRSLDAFVSVDAVIVAGSPAFWHVGKTRASIKFVLSAVRRLASGKADEAEAQMLAEAVEAVKSGERTLNFPLSIDEFLVRGFPLPWEEGKTEESKRFVREAALHAASGCDPSEAQMLAEAVEAVKSGERVLTERLAPEDFLVSGFPQ